MAFWMGRDVVVRWLGCGVARDEKVGVSTSSWVVEGGKVG